MKDIIVILVLAVLIGLATGYIVRQKKKGVRCIGCPSAGSCSAKNRGGCKCESENK